MLLTAQQILAVRTAKTRTVDVPEWGEGAQVLVGVMGGLARMEFLDWLEGLGSNVAPPAPEGESFESCDSPPPEEPGAAEALAPERLRQLEETLHHVIVVARAEHTPEELEQVLAAAEGVLSAEKVYTKAEEYRMALRWCAECILDPPTKQRAFTLAQLEALGGLDSGPIYRIADAAQAMNGATADSRADLEKNSARTPAGSSGSV